MLIAIINNKGGTGKSTLAVHLAALAHERGRSVALIDSDALTRSASHWHADLGNPYVLHQLFTADDVLEKAPDVANKVEFTVADAPAALTEVSRSLLLVADLALVPCAPSGLDLRGVHDALRVVRQIQKVRKGLPGVLLVPNRLQSGYRLTKELLEAARELGVPALDGLRQRAAFAEAGTQGTLVWRLGRSGEDATQEFYRLYDQIQSYATPKPS